MRLHRFPARYDEVLEIVAIHGPFPVAGRDVARARWDALAVFVEPDWRGHGTQRSANRSSESRLRVVRPGRARWPILLDSRLIKPGRAADDQTLAVDRDRGALLLARRRNVGLCRMRVGHAAEDVQLMKAFLIALGLMLLGGCAPVQYRLQWPANMTEAEARRIENRCRYIATTRLYGLTEVNWQSFEVCMNWEKIDIVWGGK
jgi:hypothetical protein